jgi:hypothetical protein
MSAGRFLTTHVGSLPRAQDLVDEARQEVLEWFVVF